MRLTSKNYYSLQAAREFFSVSQYKDFMKCEAAAMAKIRGEYEQPTTKALLVGSFVDAYFEKKLPAFRKEHPEIFTRKAELRSEFRKANEIIARCRNDQMFMKFMGGKKQKIMTFELFGTQWKMKMDSYAEDICITDLKVVANFRSLPYWRYDLQGAIYQKGVELKTGRLLPFYLAAVTKERVPDLDIFQIPQEVLDAALQEIGAHMPRFIAVKNGEIEPLHCGECEYCRKTKKASIRNYLELMEDKNYAAY